MQTGAQAFVPKRQLGSLEGSSSSLLLSRPHNLLRTKSKVIRLDVKSYTAPKEVKAALHYLTKSLLAQKETHPQALQRRYKSYTQCDYKDPGIPLVRCDSATIKR
jgi:hypothetical protein